MTDDVQDPAAQPAGEEKTSTYTVQVKQTGDGSWLDVATVTVPQRRQRRTVLLEALEQVGAETLPPSGRARVIDGPSAEEHPFGYKQPPAQLVIG